MGNHGMFDSKDLGPIHKFPEINKGQKGLLLEKSRVCEFM